MAGKIILLICMWICAGIFLGLSLYSRKKQEPMWFWSGEQVPRESVTDAASYNKEHSRMYLLYSLPWWAAGLLGLFHPLFAAGIAVLCCTAGLWWIIRAHKNIEKRYKKK